MNGGLIPSLRFRLEPWRYWIKFLSDAAQKNQPADQDLRCLRTAVRMAKKMGEGVGRGSVLLCAVPADEEGLTPKPRKKRTWATSAEYDAAQVQPERRGTVASVSGLAPPIAGTTGGFLCECCSPAPKRGVPQLAVERDRKPHDHQFICVTGLDRSFCRTLTN